MLKRSDNRILDFMRDSERDELSGRQIAQGAAVGAGTVYVCLLRLEDAGYVSSRWDEVPFYPGGPRRRLYRLTEDGRRRRAVTPRRRGLTDLVDFLVPGRPVTA